MHARGCGSRQMAHTEGGQYVQRISSTKFNGFATRRAVHSICTFLLHLAEHHFRLEALGNGLRPPFYLLQIHRAPTLDRTADRQKFREGIAEKSSQRQRTSMCSLPTRDRQIGCRPRAHLVVCNAFATELETPAANASPVARTIAARVQRRRPRASDHAHGRSIGEGGRGRSCV